MHIASPFLSLSTSFRSRSPKSGSDSSSPSSTTTSPPSSPTSTHSPQSSPHHLFNLSFHPSKAQHIFRGHPDSARHTNTSPGNSARPRPASDGPHNSNAVSVLPCAVLRGRSAMVIRRRLSKIDLALSEERLRCDEDAIERQGLGLMEPRPVDLGIGEVKPNFVMGGIFEVMEGRA
ncbi:uncharacterized protein N7518_001596 [Penicillium psychrosexuale]|uniref:uncharacterized protein n=1 Tax=Penicillium psychrosexuale TaxID=1002107 RepID=UPI002545912B|nr:uncharacterized protein N7518_001596 [Penicillium psychrosexuale]KAJ5799528.1 hypothetical protein N7518_001596 [Penicillium psychrosexuale]